MILSIANDIWQRLNNYTYGIKSANSDKVWLEFDTIFVLGGIFFLQSLFIAVQKY